MPSVVVAATTAADIAAAATAVGLVEITGPVDKAKGGESEAVAEEDENGIAASRSKLGLVG